MQSIFFSTLVSGTKKICLLPYKLLKLLFTQIFGTYLGNIINVGQKKTVENYNDLKNNFDHYLQKFDFLRPDLKYNNFYVQTDKNTSINTLELMPKNLEQSKEVNKYIVVFMGNSEFIEGRISFLCSMVKELRCNVISFNYRGKGGSTGKAKNIEQIISDGKKQVQRLLDSGIKSENIILYGHCFGAAIATRIAADYHKENKKIYIFNDRSFSTLSNMYSGSLKLKAPYNKRSIISSVCERLASFGVKCILNLTNWQIDVANSYKSIPEEYKDYIVIKASKADKAKRPMFDDGLIDNSASLHKSLKKIRRNQKLNCRKAIEELNAQRSKLIKGLNSDKDVIEINLCENKIKDLNNKLISIEERIMKGAPNDLMEGYTELQRKQKLKKLINKIDISLPKVLRILSELKKMESSEDFKTDSELAKKVENMKKDFEKELIEISENFINKKSKKSTKYKITNLCEFADKAADRLIDMLWEAEKQITGNPNLPKHMITELEFDNEGLAKIGHNKCIWELESRVPGETGKTRLQKFVNRTEKNDKIIIDSCILR